MSDDSDEDELARIRGGQAGIYVWRREDIEDINSTQRTTNEKPKLIKLKSGRPTAGKSHRIMGIDTLVLVFALSAFLLVWSSLCSVGMPRLCFLFPLSRRVSSHF